MNQLYGNSGNNYFRGFAGDDIMYGFDGVDRAIYDFSREDYVIIPPYATDDSSFQVLDIVPDRDGTDHLFGIEEIEFNGVLYNIMDFMDVDNNFLPDNFALFSPYPNPFNPINKIKFHVPLKEKILLSVFDINGNLVKNLNNTILDAGEYVFEWNATDSRGSSVSTGVYFVHFESPSYADTKKVLFIK